MAEPRGPLRATAGGVLLAVRLTPKAGRARVGPVAAGAAVLKVAVTAPAEKGKANAAMIALLAKTWRLPKTAITVARGAADRNKTLMIAGEPELLDALTKKIEGDG